MRLNIFRKLTNFFKPQNTFLSSATTDNLPKISVFCPPDFQINKYIPDLVNWSVSCSNKVKETLYGTLDVSKQKNVISLNIYLEHMSGVAFTRSKTVTSLVTGTKYISEIHVSIEHLMKFKSSNQNLVKELTGVIIHEGTHVYQHNGKGTANSGLIEGIADYVRLKTGNPGSNWNRKSVPATWDAGYQSTAFFLEWIENRYKQGMVKLMNEKLKDTKYSDDIFRQMTGKSVNQLFKEYIVTLKK